MFFFRAIFLGGFARFMTGEAAQKKLTQERLKDNYKTLPITILYFLLRLHQAAQKGYQANSITFQTFLLAFLLSLENLKFHNERVL